MIGGQVIAITGAGSGIGRASAWHLAQCGAKVVLGARHEEGLSGLAEEIGAIGGQAVYRVTDVRKREDLKGLVTLAQQTYGRLDVLFSNAGAMPIVPFDDLAVDDWETMVDVNIKGVLFGIAAALPVFRKQGSGHFIHTASTAARKTVPNQVVYSATKTAVLAISDGQDKTSWSHPSEFDPAGFHGHCIQGTCEKRRTQRAVSESRREVCNVPRSHRTRSCMHP